MKKILVVQGGGRPNGKPQIDGTGHRDGAYRFGQSLYNDAGNAAR